MNRYCLLCGFKLMDQDKACCSCGSENTLTGKNLLRVGNGFACVCGNSRVMLLAHNSSVEKEEKLHKCIGCGSSVSQVIGRKK